MKKESDIGGIPSKSSIIKAWIALLVLSLCLAGLIYTKKTYKPKDSIELETPETIPEVVVASLNEIVNNFNNNKDVTELKEKNEIYVATLEGKNIIINYTKEENVAEVRYEYDLFNHTLSSSSTNVDKEVFENIFKLLVNSCQLRLQNTDDISSYLDKFLKGENVYGLSKNEDIYSIDIIVKLGDIPNNEQESNDNNDNNIEANVMDAIRRGMQQDNTNNNTAEDSVSNNSNNNTDNNNITNNQNEENSNIDNNNETNNLVTVEENTEESISE